MLVRSGAYETTPPFTVDFRPLALARMGWLGTGSFQPIPQGDTARSLSRRTVQHDSFGVSLRERRSRQVPVPCMRTVGKPHRKSAGLRGLLFLEHEFGIKTESMNVKRSYLTSL